MKPELKRYLDPYWEEQPNWLTADLRRLCHDLQSERSDEGWMRVAGNLRDMANQWAASGALGGNVAASVLFIADALEAALTAEGVLGGAVVLGYVLQLTLTAEDWTNFLEVIAADNTGGSADNDPVRLQTFHDTVLMHFAKRGRHDVLRNLYRLVRYRTDALARRAMRDAKDFDSWIGDLALLAANLSMRRWLPLTVNKGLDPQDGGRIELVLNDDGAMDGGRFVAPPRCDHPALAVLFEADEIASLHRKEAYAAECFAHLFAAITSGNISAAYQAMVTECYHRWLAQDRLGARQWLTFGKSRFEIAPYVK